MRDEASGHRYIGYLALVLICGLPPAAHPAPGTKHEFATVTVAEGQLRGLRIANAGAIFRGVPYARPPVGSLRWRPPEPPPSWTGTQAASDPAPPCLQVFVGWNRADAQRGSEDCLYLTIRTPKLDRRAALPVLVWIHGGANWAGSGAWVAESDLAARCIVVVGVEYRLGVFGFLSHPDLSRESPHRVSGNYALMDQIAALRWVHRNIEAFGGDPSSVTIGGDSAGGQDVGLLMLSPQARGLFARAIQQSGTAGFGLPPRSLAENEQLGVQFAELAGAVPPQRQGWREVPTAAAAAVMADAEPVDPTPSPPEAGTPANAQPPDPEGGQIAILRRIPGRKLLDAQMLLRTPALEDQSFLFLQATADGWVIPFAPAQLLTERRLQPVPLLIGNAAQELPLMAGETAARRAVVRAFGRSASAALELYGLRDGLEPEPDPVLGNTSLQIATDLTFRCPASFTAHVQANAGQLVWRYQLEHAAPDARAIAHGAELPFVFRNLPLDPMVDGSQPYIQHYWVNFMRTGDPNGQGLPAWPAYGEDEAYLGLTGKGPIAHHQLRSQICALLDRP